MKKIMILGSTGMLGHQVYLHFKKFSDYEIVDVSFRNIINEDTILLNVKNKDEVIKLLNDIKPDYIVNCIGVLISGSIKDSENAVYINSYFPHLLVKIANDINAKIIHISTDCVFSGDRGQYIESDIKDGKDLYAKSKALGEIIDNKNTTLRTSIIGPELKKDGEGLFNWFINQEGVIQGYQKSIWSGVTTFELAKAIKWAIDEDIVGLYHITNNKSICKFDLLRLFKKYTNKDILIEPVDGNSINKSIIDTRNEINYKIPEYEQMISQMVQSLSTNSLFYEEHKF